MGLLYIKTHQIARGNSKKTNFFRYAPLTGPLKPGFLQVSDEKLQKLYDANRVRIMQLRMGSKDNACSPYRHLLYFSTLYSTPSVSTVTRFMRCSWTGRSWKPVGVLAIWSTTSMPSRTMPKAA